MEKVSHQRLHLFQGGDGLVVEIGAEEEKDTEEEKDGRKKMEAAYTRIKEMRPPTNQDQMMMTTWRVG